MIAFILALALTAPAGTFHQCGLTGTAKPQRVKDLNLLKNRSVQPTIINTAITAAALIAPGADTDRWSTDDGAEIDAYVVNIKPGGAESVNCQATDPKWKDTHIELGLTRDAPANARIVVEITPRWRAAQAAVGVDWSTATLRKLIGQRVTVRGWMFFDGEHVNAAETTHPHGAHNWRATAWEIHPITAIEVQGQKAGSR